MRNKIEMKIFSTEVFIGYPRIRTNILRWFLHKRFIILK